jgi:endonuclease YncB( thermonuclease family)
MRIFLLFLLLPLFISQAGATANAPDNSAFPKAKFATMKKTGAGRIEAVIDAHTILLKDGKIVRILGIDYPSAAGADTGPAKIAAKDRLSDLLSEGSEIVLYQSFNTKTGRENRMGHVLAHLALKEDGRWINGTLIAEGLGWVVTDRSNPEMAAELYALEETARAEKRGLWSDKLLYGVLPADRAEEGLGTFRLVEGTVTRAATSRNNLYLNFGNDMKTDFTVMISPSLRKTLARRGIDPLGLAGKQVRVRGWLRSWNGPFMQIETAERLQILSTAQSTDSPTEPLESGETRQQSR